MKKILFIGAGFLQSFVIQKAKDMGYYTLAIDKNPKAIGFKYADEICEIDIVDEKACLNYAEIKNIDGVMTAATDYGVLSTAYIAKEMNLPGVNYGIAENVKNKYLVRKILSQNKIDDLNQFYEVTNQRELNTIKKKISFPIIVKPVDGSGSRGTNRVNGLNELFSAYEEAYNNSLSKNVLIEDFIEGTEYGIESFVYNNQIYILSVIGKAMTAPPNYAEIGHYLPCRLNIEDKIRKVVKNAIKALEINYGSVNMDIIINKKEEVFIIDVGIRMGGNLIGSHLIPINTEIDYMGLSIQAAVGDFIEFTSPKEGKKVATRLLTLRPGKIKKLPDFDYIIKKYKVELFHHLEEGLEIKDYKNNLDGLGYIIAQSTSLEDATVNAESAHNYIDSEIIRENKRY